MVPRCKWEMINVLSISGRFCWSTKHSNEHRGGTTRRLHQSLGLLASAVGLHLVCQSCPFPVPKQYSFPRSTGQRSRGERWALLLQALLYLLFPCPP